MSMKTVLCRALAWVSVALFVWSHALPGDAVVVANKGTRPVRYVGSEVCKSCHEKEYHNFSTYAKKATSFRSIERVRKGLTEDEIKGCYACHTTGYGKPGGFVSPEKTPHLKNAGCEVCHGPGEVHVRTRDARFIKRKLHIADCEVCHIAERVRAFRYKPLIHGGAH